MQQCSFDRNIVQFYGAALNISYSCILIQPCPVAPHAGPKITMH